MILLRGLRYQVTPSGSLTASDATGTLLWELPLHPGPLDWLALEGEHLVTGDTRRTAVYRVNPDDATVASVARLKREADYRQTPRADRLETRLSPEFRRTLHGLLDHLRVVATLAPRPMPDVAGLGEHLERIQAQALAEVAPDLPGFVGHLLKHLRALAQHLPTLEPLLPAGEALLAEGVPIAALAAWEAQLMPVLEKGLNQRVWSRTRELAG